MHSPDRPTAVDLDSSATIRDIGSLNRALSHIRGDGKVLADLGCGYGWLGHFVAERLGIEDVHGFDLDRRRLAVAAQRGLKTAVVDLERDQYPLGDATVDVAVSFGTLEHFVWWDHFMTESTRILRPGGWLVLAAPNLGSYLNRIALLLGFQPRDVAISTNHLVGVLPGYKRGPLAHVHVATLRATTQLMTRFGFEIVASEGSSPDFGYPLLCAVDRLVGRFPSLARRYIIVARRPVS
jgi:SAM-dependent methyltransferase